MRRAFTLIELLVVITIIAIVAAILFPVFAKARIAAYKAAAIANQRQIGLAIVMYAADHDDVYPRNDGCEQGASLNPDHWDDPFVANGAGCMGPFFNRTNHYKWQSWVAPYVRDLKVFEYPNREKFQDAWETDGELFNGFALNLALTGRINNYTYTPSYARSSDVSWLGGVQTNVPDPARAMLLFEYGHEQVNFAPILYESAQTGFNKVGYPTAVREWWAYNIMKWVDPDDCSQGVTNQPDPRAVTDGGLVLGFCDGHSAFVTARRFLALTPTAAEYGVNIPPSRACGQAGGNFVTSTKPNLRIDYPLWGLSSE